MTSPAGVVAQLAGVTHRYGATVAVDAFSHVLQQLAAE